MIKSIEKMDQYYDLNKILKTNCAYFFFVAVVPAQTEGFFFNDGLFWDGWCNVVEV